MFLQSECNFVMQNKLKMDRKKLKVVDKITKMIINLSG